MDVVGLLLLEIRPDVPHSVRRTPLKKNPKSSKMAQNMAAYEKLASYDVWNIKKYVYRAKSMDPIKRNKRRPLYVFTVSAKSAEKR